MHAVYFFWRTIFSVQTAPWNHIGSFGRAGFHFRRIFKIPILDLDNLEFAIFVVEKAINPGRCIRELVDTACF